MVFEKNIIINLKDKNEVPNKQQLLLKKKRMRLY